MEFPERGTFGDCGMVDVMVARDYEQSFGRTAGSCSDFFQPRLGPRELIRAPVVGNIACNEDGVEFRSPLFAQISEQSFTDLHVAIKLGVGVGGREMEVGEMEEG